MQLPKPKRFIALLFCSPLHSFAATDCPIFLNDFHKAKYESGLSADNQLLANDFNKTLSDEISSVDKNQPCYLSKELENYNTFSIPYCSQTLPKSKTLDELDGNALRATWVTDSLAKKKMELECLSRIKNGLELAQSAWPVSAKAPFEGSYDKFAKLEALTEERVKEEIAKLVTENQSTKELNKLKLALTPFEDIKSEISTLIAEIDPNTLVEGDKESADKFKETSIEDIEQGKPISTVDFNDYQKDTAKQKKAEALNGFIQSSYHFKLSKENIAQQLSAINAQIEKASGEVATLELEQKGDANAVLAQLEQENRLGETQSDDAGLESFFAGFTYSPKYEDGENKGFEQANAFLRLNLDLRLERTGYIDAIKQSKYESVSFFDTIHFGATAHLGSESRFECDENDTECQKGKIPAASSIKFNDVSDVLDLSLYVNPNIYHSLTGNVEAGFTVRAGVRTKENLNTTSGDNLDEYYQVGARWASYYESWYRHPKRKSDYSNSVNSLPFVVLELKYGYYQGFAGFKRDYRMIADMAFRPFQERPFYFGVHINGAEGPDHVDLFMMYSFSPFDMLSRL